jgi:hypothetical protein
MAGMLPQNAFRVPVGFGSCIAKAATRIRCHFERRDQSIDERGILIADGLALSIRALHKMSSCLLWLACDNTSGAVARQFRCFDDT